MKENPCVYKAIKTSQKRKGKAAATKIPRSNGGKGPSSTVSPFDIWTNPFPTQKPNTVIFFPSSSSRPKSLKSLKWRVEKTHTLSLSHVVAHLIIFSPKNKSNLNYSLFSIFKFKTSFNSIHQPPKTWLVFASTTNQRKSICSCGHLNLYKTSKFKLESESLADTYIHLGFRERHKLWS